MKNTFLFIALFGLMVACHKPLVDYRSKYVGTYDVVSYNTAWVMGQVQQFDTTHYSLKVKRSNERYYVEFISPSGTTPYLLETDGTLHYESYDWHYQANGSFLDKNHFVLTGGYYGLGGGNSFEAHGTKK
ncbi:MAG: hypothetical protein FJZ80_02365 [Bacteroidetes bacterium]|nr:hypothetical protein [Bacteroidota bacterium]